jgi:hypothetical protein
MDYQPKGEHIMKRQEFEYNKDYPSTKLNSKGQCCGRKPLVYKRPHFHTFCCKCHRSHNEAGEQINNWAWLVASDVCRRKKPTIGEQNYTVAELVL